MDYAAVARENITRIKQLLALKDQENYPSAEATALAREIYGWGHSEVAFNTGMQTLRVGLAEKFSEDEIQQCGHTMGVQPHVIGPRTAAVAWKLFAAYAGPGKRFQVLNPCAAIRNISSSVPDGVEFHGVALDAISALVLNAADPTGRYRVVSAKRFTPPEESYSYVMGVCPREDERVFFSDKKLQKAQSWFYDCVVNSLQTGGLGIVLRHRGFDLSSLSRVADILLRTEVKEEDTTTEIIVFRKRTFPRVEGVVPSVQQEEDLEMVLGLLRMQGAATTAAAKSTSFKTETIDETLAVAAYRALKKLFAADIEGDPTADAQRDRARRAFSALRDKVGPIDSALSNKQPLARMAATREGRLLLRAEQMPDLLQRTLIRSKRKVAPGATAEDAVRESLDIHNKIVRETVAESIGCSLEDADAAIKELVFDDPLRGETLASEYLSGDVRIKLEEAVWFASFDDRHQRCVNALSAVLPPATPLADLKVPIGARWLPEELVAEFAGHLCGGQPVRDFEVRRIANGAGWVVKTASYRSKSSIGNTITYGVDNLEGIEILEQAMNLKIPVVFKMVAGSAGDAPEKVLDVDATAAARGKLEDIKIEWDRWLRDDERRITALRDIYDKLNSGIVPMKLDGEHLTLPGLNLTRQNSTIPLDARKHQRRAIERVVRKQTLDDSALIVHHVGFGKTMSAVCAAVRRWQLGETHKSLIVVPKPVIRQWENAFKFLFPTLADEVMVCSSEFSKDERSDFFRRVAKNEAAFVIMTYEHFNHLHIQDEAVRAVFEQESVPLFAAYEDAGKRSSKKDEQKIINKELTAVVKLQERALGRNRDRFRKLEKAGEIDLPMWEQIVGDPRKTMVIIDEWQYLKRFPVRTRMERISGMPSGESFRAIDGLVKLRYVLDRGGKIVGLTGTPESNTLAEAFVSMCFFQPKRLRRMGCSVFDAWAGTFTEPVVSVEMDAVGMYREVTRLRFVNLDELMLALGTCRDFASEAPELQRPTIVGGEPVVIETPGSEALIQYVQELAARAEDVRSGGVDPSEDNMLKITSDGRRAALWNGSPHTRFPEPVGRFARGDLLATMDEEHHEEEAPSTSFTLVNGEEVETPHRRTKIDDCADKVWEIYAKHHQHKGVQLVFLDVGTPKKVGDEATADERQLAEGIYGALRSRLIDRGILREQIAFIHEAASEQEREEMLAAVNAGKIRVLLGSSEKLGVGVNAQKRAVAVHHLDCPWRPDLLMQRTGRVDRDGNDWTSVYVFYYVTARSYDVCLWQLIQVKADFVAKLQRGTATSREADDVGDLVLTAAMAKAVALGDLRVLEKIKTENELAQLERQHRSFEAAKINVRKELDALPTKRAEKEAVVIGLRNAGVLPPAEIDGVYVMMREISSPDHVPVGTPEDADGRIHALATMMKPLLRKPMRIGTFRSKPLYIEMLFGAVAATLDLGGGAKLTCYNIHAVGTFADLERQIAHIEVKIKKEETELASMDGRETVLWNEVGKEWGSAQRAEELLKKYDDLCDALAQNGLSDRKTFKF